MIYYIIIVFMSWSEGQSDRWEKKVRQVERRCESKRNGVRAGGGSVPIHHWDAELQVCQGALNPF